MDLNLLEIFASIGKTLNLSTSSRDLGLSQPAVSHALARLRENFHDPLFVRAARGVVPTPRALQLLPKIQSLLVDLTTLYSSKSPQALKERTDPLHLAVTTYFEIQIITDLLLALKNNAPHVSLKTSPLQGELPRLELERGEVDLAIAGYFSELPEAFRVKTIFSEPYVLVMRQRHPYLKSKKTVETYLGFRHVKIDIPPGQPAEIDHALSERGLKRSNHLALSNFSTPPMVLSHSDLILTCPRSLGKTYAKLFNLALAPPPLSLRPLQVKMVWHERTHSDPLHSWLRNEISNCLKI